MSKKLRIILAAALAVILIAIVALAVTANNKPYTELYQDMTPSEIQEVTTYLQNSGFTDYQVVNNAIMVPNTQYASLIAQLAQQGYPKNASLYGSYWEHVGTMSTNSERETAYLIAVQEQLETNIRTMTNVLDASVKITPGESRVYVLEDISTATSAYVKVTMRSGQTLSEQQAEGIRLMVSKAWSGMTIDDVGIVDNIGNTYTGGSEASASDSLELQRVLEERTANRIRTQVKHVLDGLYGEDNVQVAVGVSVDVSRRYTESTYYHQPEGSYENGGLIGHELGYYALTRDGYQLVGGVPGTTSDSDIPTYVQDLAQDTQDNDGIVSSYERDNNIDETKEQIEFLAPTVSDVSIAVTINANANPGAGVDVEQLQHHVAMAGNVSGEIPEDKVSILIAAFPVEPEPEVRSGLIPQEYVPYVIIAAAALLLIIILIVVIISIRKKKKKQQEEEDQRIIQEQLSELGASGALSELGIVPPLGEEGEVPPPTSGADIMEINTEKSMELRKAVRQFVQNNPEVAAIMLKNWLRGGDDDNG
ncbi:MAG: flagellar M-ring protein FliF [Oscillospiraceae bacterium]|nr:flagellar M-ring protein FliF [Oscillospiraceae bacterium]